MAGGAVSGHGPVKERSCCPAPTSIPSSTASSPRNWNCRFLGVPSPPSASSAGTVVAGVLSLRGLARSVVGITRYCRIDPGVDDASSVPSSEGVGSPFSWDCCSGRGDACARASPSASAISTSAAAGGALLAGEREAGGVAAFLAAERGEVPTRGVGAAPVDGAGEDAGVAAAAAAGDLAAAAATAATGEGAAAAGLFLGEGVLPFATAAISTGDSDGISSAVEAVTVAVAVAVAVTVAVTVAAGDPLGEAAVPLGDRRGLGAAVFAVPGAEPSAVSATEGKENPGEPTLGVAAAAAAADASTAATAAMAAEALGGAGVLAATSSPASGAGEAAASDILAVREEACGREERKHAHIC